MQFHYSNESIKWTIKASSSFDCNTNGVYTIFSAWLNQRQLAEPKSAQKTLRKYDNNSDHCLTKQKAEFNSIEHTYKLRPALFLYPAVFSHFPKASYIFPREITKGNLWDTSQQLSLDNLIFPRRPWSRNLFIPVISVTDVSYTNTLTRQIANCHKHVSASRNWKHILNVWSWLLFPCVTNHTKWVWVPYLCVSLSNVYSYPDPYFPSVLNLQKLSDLNNLGEIRFMKKTSVIRLSASSFLPVLIWKSKKITKNFEALFTSFFVSWEKDLGAEFLAFPSSSHEVSSGFLIRTVTPKTPPWERKQDHILSVKEFLNIGW